MYKPSLFATIAKQVSFIFLFLIRSRICANGPRLVRKNKAESVIHLFINTNQTYILYQKGMAVQQQQAFITCLWHMCHKICCGIHI